MTEFPGTPDHFRLHVQVAHALDALDHRHVWLRLSVVGGRPASAAAIETAVREIDAWLKMIKGSTSTPTATSSTMFDRRTPLWAMRSGSR
jgi:hypothetical protein